MSPFTGIQTSAAKRFEVATVKENRTGGDGLAPGAAAAWKRRPEAQTARGRTRAAKIRAGESCASIGPIAPFAAGITNTTIGALVSALARSIQDRPIIDKTGLTGKYDALVRWMPDNMKPEDLANIPADLRPEDVSLFTALEQQLGLKLEAQKGPVDVVVVDSLEKPAEN